MDLIKIAPDKEKARSLVKLAMLRQGKIKLFDPEAEGPLLTEAYYEICKELITAILFCDGYKTLSHTDLIEYLKRYPELTEQERFIVDTLRKMRNQIVYYGITAQTGFTNRNEEAIKRIIGKLKKLCEEKTGR